MERRVTVIIPVYNEAKQFGESKKNGYFHALRQWQAADSERRNILFVNDGSTDRTSRILEKEKFQVISSSSTGKNRGKGDALLRGIVHAYKKHDAHIAVTLDADILNLTPEKIDALIAPMLTANPPSMVVSTYHEGGRLQDGKLSGERAIRLSSMSTALNKTERLKNLVTISRGWGIEEALNDKLKNRVVVHGGFHCEKAFRTDTATKQSRDMTRTRVLLNEEKEFARRIMKEKESINALPSENRIAARKALLAKIAKYRSQDR